MTRSFSPLAERRTPLKKLIAGLLIVLATVFSFVSPVLAADGAALFTANCSACHAGGNNAVVPPKKLTNEAFDQFLDGYKDKGAEGAIAYQVQHGKGAMPAFARLTDEEVAAIASYVADKAANGW